MTLTKRYFVLAIIALCLLHTFLEENVGFVIVSAKPVTESSRNNPQPPYIISGYRIRRPMDHFTTIKASITTSTTNNNKNNNNNNRTILSHAKLRQHQTSPTQSPSRTRTTTPSSSSTTISTSRSSTTKTTTTATTSALIHGMKNAIASAAAAACCKAILQPIDAMKTVQQYNVGQHSLSLYQAAQQLIQKPGGYQNLYAGLGVTMIGSMPSVGLYFGVYSYCKQRFLATQRGRRHTTASIALSAAIGNTIASATRVPYEVMKQHLQTGVYDSTWSLFREMIHHPNTISQLLFPKGGIWIQMIRDVPYAVVTLLLYESLQQHFGNTVNNNKSQQSIRNSNSSTGTNVPLPSAKSPIRDALLGGFAGGVGSWVTNPMDVIKTRLQTDTNGRIYSGSVLTCATTVWNEGGASAFLRGSVPRLVHKVPANAFFFLFYEFFRRILHT